MTKGYFQSKTVIPNGIAWATMGSEAMSAVYDLRWMILAVVLLIAADAYNGTRESFMLFDEAKKRSDKMEMERNRFHLSRFCRRTICKLIEYLTYLLIGCVLGLAILEPCGICSHVISAAIGLGVGALCEISSIAGHFLILHHITLPRFTWNTAGSFFGQVLAIFIKQKNEDLGQAVSDAVHETFKDGKENNDKSTKYTEL